MNSRERMLAAIRGQDVDHVPFCIRWNWHKALSWANERERLEYHNKMGLDAMINISPSVSPTDHVTFEKQIVVDGDGRNILCQKWKTPAGELTERLHKTDDWYIEDNYHGIGDDWHTARYIEFPFKEEKDLDCLPYIFPENNPKDEEYIVTEFKKQKALSDEFGFPLFVTLDAGMDWLMWLYPAEEFLLRMVDRPMYIEKLLAAINKAKHNRLELLLKLGVDGVIRRGYYESADFWSPKIYRRHAKPVIKKEIDMTHAMGKVYLYLMLTGIKPFLHDLADLDFDCLFGAEPPPVGLVSLKEVHDALPGKSFWGGISDTAHFAFDSPEPTVRAVEEAFGIFGKKGFILGMAPNFKEYMPYENFLAAEETWRKLR